MELAQLAEKSKTIFVQRTYVNGRDIGCQRPIPSQNHLAIADLLEGMTAALA